MAPRYFRAFLAERFVSGTLTLLLGFVLMAYGMCGLVLPAQACCQTVGTSLYSNSQSSLSGCHHSEESQNQSKSALRDCCIKPVLYPIATKNWSPPESFQSPVVLIGTANPGALLSQYWEFLNKRQAQTMLSTAWLKDESDRHLELSVLLN